MLSCSVSVSRSTALSTGTQLLAAVVGLQVLTVRFQMPPVDLQSLSLGLQVGLRILLVGLQLTASDSCCRLLFSCC